MSFTQGPCRWQWTGYTSRLCTLVRREEANVFISGKKLGKTHLEMDELCATTIFGNHHIHPMGGHFCYGFARFCEFICAATVSLGTCCFSPMSYPTHWYSHFIRAMVAKKLRSIHGSKERLHQESSVLDGGNLHALQKGMQISPALTSSILAR